MDSESDLSLGRADASPLYSTNSMMEQERDRNKGKAPKSSGPRSQTFETRPKMTSGGMSASLDSDGHLIWD